MNRSYLIDDEPTGFWQGEDQGRRFARPGPPIAASRSRTRVHPRAPTVHLTGAVAGCPCTSIARCAGVVSVPTVLRPLPDVAMHVVQPKRVRLLLGHRIRLGFQSGKALIARIAVATDDALINPGQFNADDIRGARSVDDVVDYGAGVKHPQVPAVSDLASNIDKDSPASFIGMPIGLAAQLGLQRCIEWFEQGCYCLQAACQSSWRHVQAVVSQIL